MLLKELLFAYRNNDKPLYLILEDVGEWVSAGIVYCATYSTIADIDPFNKLSKLNVINFYTETLGGNSALHVNISLPNASFLK